MRIYAVIDANVLLSAMISHNRDAATTRVVRAVLAGKVVPLYNYEIMAEYDEVLHRRRFNLDEEDVRRMLSEFVRLGVRSNRVPVADVVRDPKDVVFYEVALSKEDTYLVTGNIKDFPATPIVVTPAEMIGILVELGVLDGMEGGGAAEEQG